MEIGGPRWCRVATALLRTATSTGDAARSAWSSLPPDFDLDEIWDPDLSGLLAAAGRALSAAGSEDPALPRLAGIVRKNWVEQQLELRHWAPIAAALTAAGLEVWAAGGVVLTGAEWGFGGAHGERAAGDTRLVVRRADASAAADAVRELGVLRRSPEQVHRRAELHGGVTIQLADDRWGELAWAPSPWWPVASEPLAPGDPVRVGETTVMGIPPYVAVVAAAIDATFGPSPLRALLDLHRMVSSGLITGAEIDATADEIGAGPVVARAVDVVGRLRDGGDLPLADWLGPAHRASARHHLRSANFRLGTGPMLVAAPRLLADRWRLERTAQLPAAFGSRLVERLSRRRG